MFPNVLHATLIAFIVSAVTVSALPSISVKVSGEPAVTDIDKLVVNTTVTNTGDEIITLLNHPESPLNKLPANQFTITDATGSSPAFIGVKAKYVPATAIAVGKDAVTVLAPGQSVEIEHKLSEAYAFDKEGEYKIVSNNQFYLVNVKKEAATINATVNTYTTTLTGKLSTDRFTQVKRATYYGCSSSEQSSLVSAASGAQSYAANAYSYLYSHTSSTSRFDTWFGTYASSRHSVVLSHFDNISNNNFASFNYDCTCTDSGVYAYVYPDDFGYIYLCGAFWNAPVTGTDSKARLFYLRRFTANCLLQSGTLVHESSHFTLNGGTDDYVYGQSGAQSLAISNPNQAIFNADNHEYFAENNPALS